MIKSSRILKKDKKFFNIFESFKNFPCLNTWLKALPPSPFFFALFFSGDFLELFCKLICTIFLFFWGKLTKSFLLIFWFVLESIFELILLVLLLDLRFPLLNFFSFVFFWWIKFFIYYIFFNIGTTIISLKHIFRGSSLWIWT